MNQETENRNRRDLDRRFEKVDTDIKNVANVHAEEMSNIEGQLSSFASWQSKHDSLDEERWKNNGEKWVAAEKKFDGMDFKLNAIIGTSFITLITACGFFITLWIDRQEQKAEKHSSEIPMLSARIK